MNAVIRFAALSMALLWAAALPARAELPKAELGEAGKQEAAVTQGNLRAVLAYRPGSGGDETGKIPHLYLAINGQFVITLKGISSGFDWPQAEATIAELDPSNPYPEVVFTTFSGGAHCCQHVLIATSSADGRSWKALSAGDYDGGISLKDLDGDGRIELEVSDGRFNYVFASYAGSVSPPMIYHLQGPKLTDVTRQAPFQPYLRQRAAELDQRMADIGNQHERNGVLAGYVALKVLIGEGAAAWNVMLNSYDRTATEGLTSCQAGTDDQGRCKAPETRFPDFPKALAAFLRRTGYL